MREGSRPLAPPPGLSLDAERVPRRLASDLGGLKHAVPTPKSQRADVKRSVAEQWVLEIFAGSGRLSGALRRRGVNTLEPMELKSGDIFDLSRRSTQLVVLELARSGLLAYAHIGIPCTAWSIARRGLKKHATARLRERLAVEFAFFSSALCRILSQRGCLWSIENPASSQLWQFEPIVDLRSLLGTFFVRFDMCAYDAPHKKPTSLLTNVFELAYLDKRCPGVSASHKHSPLVGGRKTAPAGEYPLSLCNAWSAALCRCLDPTTCFGDAGDQSDQFLAALDTAAHESQLRRRAGSRHKAASSLHYADPFLAGGPAIRFGQDPAAVRWSCGLCSSAKVEGDSHSSS